MSVAKVVKMFAGGKLNPVDLCEMCLQMASASSELNAFVSVTKERARDEAKQSLKRYQQGNPLGPLDGIPIAVKDNFNIKGLNTTCASLMLKNYVSPYTATVVQKLLSSGAVLIGKTNMDEFAMGTGTVDSLFGPVRNPWCVNLSEDDEDFLICGGSSGGSAAAVASGVCLIALGSDTGGSTRAPAAMCGVVGLKPTYGLLSRWGLVPLVNSLDVPGILSASVDDCRLTLDLMAGHDPLDSTTVTTPYESFILPDNPSVKGLKIGVPKEFYTKELSDDVVDAWHMAAHLLESGGALLASVSLPHTSYSLSCYSVINGTEVASNFARYDGIEYGYRSKVENSTDVLFAKSRSSGFNDVVRERILAGNFFLLKRNYDRYFQKALKVRRLVAQDYQKVFSDGVDILITPTTHTEAPKYKDFRLKHNREQVALHDYCTQPINLAGIPAISIPIQLSKNNLPIGLQLIGNHFQEKLLLTVAKYLEQQVSFRKLRFLEDNIEQVKISTQDY